MQYCQMPHPGSNVLRHLIDRCITYLLIYLLTHLLTYCMFNKHNPSTQSEVPVEYRSLSAVAMEGFWLTHNYKLTQTKLTCEAQALLQRGLLFIIKALRLREMLLAAIFIASISMHLASGTNFSCMQACISTVTTVYNEEEISCPEFAFILSISLTTIMHVMSFLIILIISCQGLYIPGPPEDEEQINEGE